jgi:hypothetical protein
MHDLHGLARRSVANILILVLEHDNIRTLCIGNKGIRRLGQGKREVAVNINTSDKYNKVQIIRNEKCLAGTFRSRVFSFSIAKLLQEFALVLTGNKISPATPDRELLNNCAEGYGLE